MGTQAAIQLNGLRKSYGSVEALKGVDVEVGRGQIVGLIGPDGAGKTTLMRIACGLVLPTAGTASLAGYDSRRESRKLRNVLGYMPQRFSLYPDLTVMENLRFFADLYLVARAEFGERAQSMLQFSRLQPFTSRRAGALSGGMKQKLALACTLIHTPEVLVLDEPTFGVDPVSRREFWDILEQLKADNLAILVSTAYMDEASLCDQIQLLHKGEVLATGPPHQVAGAFPHKLLAIEGEDVREALRLLRSRLADSYRVHRFGGALHVTYDEQSEAHEIRNHLQGLRVRTRDLQPSVEDVFVERMQRRAAT